MSTTSISTELKKGQLKNLLIATLLSAVGFWSWTLIGPLAKTYYAKTMDLTPTQISVLVAMPILVGSLVRIPVGALTDNYGGRKMYAVVLGITAPIILCVAFAGSIGSYPLLLVFAFLLGIGGTVFAVGLPFANLWYEKENRGFSSGVFGAGMAGTALNAFFTPRLFNAFGYWGLHITMAVVVALSAVLSLVLLKESPLRADVKPEPIMPKIIDACKLRATWQLSFICAVAFGAFISFSNYLPTYLFDVYGLNAAQAGTRTAGFALAAVIARPIGGTLADKIGPRVICLTSFGVVAVLAMCVALQPDAEHTYGALFIAMAAALGFCIGGMFAWLGHVIPAVHAGSASGIVGAIGGFGGYFPPLVMGATYNAELHSYFIGLTLLAVFSVIAFLDTLRIKNGSRAAVTAR